jgi:hypothetical protein
MSATRNLARRALRHVCERLERLHEALENLGRRLHDSIAQLIGSQVGEVVREAIYAVLRRSLARPPGHDPPLPEPRFEQFGHSRAGAGLTRRDPYHDDPYRQEHYPDDPYRDDPWGAPAYPDDHFDDRDSHELRGRPAAVTVPGSVNDQPALGWWALLPPVVQLADWWLRRLPRRLRWVQALAVGTAAALGAVTAGPLASALTATATALVLLGSLANHI